MIHTAFNHDFSRFAENAEQDRHVSQVLGGSLEGSDRPLLVTSGLSGLKRGATEADVPAPGLRKSEDAARALAGARCPRRGAVRLAPSVHGVGETHGFMPVLIRLAREKGVSAYLDDGMNCWSGVHRVDAARVFRLALEGGVTESVYHAVAEEAVPFPAIATAIGRGLGAPVAFPSERALRLVRPHGRCRHGGVQCSDSLRARLGADRTRPAHRFGRPRVLRRLMVADGTIPNGGSHVTRRQDGGRHLWWPRHLARRLRAAGGRRVIHVDGGRSRSGA